MISTNQNRSRCLNLYFCYENNTKMTTEDINVPYAYTDMFGLHTDICLYKRVNVGTINLHKNTLIYIKIF